MSRSRPAFRAPAAAVLAAAAAALGFAPAAQAAKPATSWEGRVTERPFMRWLDLARYVLAPNGTVERGGSWALAGGAVRAPGNETYYVHDAGDAWSLAIPSGASATSAPMCVGLKDPTLRLFARNRGSLASPLLVEVLFKDHTGRSRAEVIGTYLGFSSWQPTPPLAVFANVQLSGESVDVAFRFTAFTGGDWSIDDVYVDPFRHG